MASLLLTDCDIELPSCKGFDSAVHGNGGPPFSKGGDPSMRYSMLTPNNVQTIADNGIEVSVRGRWVRVPALEVNGKTLIVRGRGIRMAVVHDEEWLETDLEDPELCVRKLKEHGVTGVRADIFTFTQKTPGTPPKFAYAMEWDSVAAARTTSFKEWWENLPQESRKNVRRSQKRGVIVTIKDFDDELIRGIMGVNNDSPMRQGRANIHFGKSFELVKKDQFSFLDRSNFVCAYFNNQLVGYLKVVYRGNVASILDLAVKASHNDKRPANALVAKVVELCEAKGVSYLTFGMFNHGNKRESPLREFKSRNGFAEVLTPRYYIALTRWGRFCIGAKLHRGILGILPENMIRLGLNARLTWYNFKLSMSRRSSMAEQPKCNRQTGCSNPPAGSST